MTFGPSRRSNGNGWGNTDEKIVSTLTDDGKYNIVDPEARNRYNNKETTVGDILCTVATAACIVATAGFISSLFTGGKNKTKRKKRKNKKPRTKSRRSYP